MATKVYPDAAAALDGLLFDGMQLCSGGFGVCGIPERLIDAILASGVRDLTIASNNCGIGGVGLGKLLVTRQIRKMISSYIGGNPSSSASTWRASSRSSSVRRARAERCRAGGAGIPAFYTKTGSAR